MHHRGGGGRCRIAYGQTLMSVGKQYTPLRLGSSPIVHHSKHPSFTVQALGDSHGFTSLDMDCKSHFRCHTLDSGLFMELPDSFSFSGSAVVSAVLWASLSCRLRITYTVTKHRKVHTSKKNWRPRNLWYGNKINQESEGVPLCTKHHVPRYPADTESEDGLLGHIQQRASNCCKLESQNGWQKKEKELPRYIFLWCYIKRRDLLARRCHIKTRFGVEVNRICYNHWTVSHGFAMGMEDHLQLPSCLPTLPRLDLVSSACQAGPFCWKMNPRVRDTLHGPCTTSQAALRLGSLLLLHYLHGEGVRTGCLCLCW